MASRIYLVMRLDGPKTEAPFILPPGEGGRRYQRLGNEGW